MSKSTMLEEFRNTKKTITEVVPLPGGRDLIYYTDHATGKHFYALMDAAGRFVCSGRLELQ